MSEKCLSGARNQSPTFSGNNNNVTFCESDLYLYRTYCSVRSCIHKGVGCACKTCKCTSRHPLEKFFFKIGRLFLRFGLETKFFV